MGNIRFYAVIIAVVLIWLPFILIFNSIYPILFYFILTFAAIPFYALYRKLNAEKFAFKLITDDEWEHLCEHKVIHYSNFAQEQSNAIIVHLPAHYSEKTNYLLPREQRNKGFVWFHLSREKNDDEPELYSFLSAHYNEGNPRKYKSVMNIKDLPRDRVYIEKSTGFFLVEGDLSAPAQLFDKFEWYNQKMYWGYFLESTIFTLVNVGYFSAVQILGIIKDKKKQTKVQISKNSDLKK